MRHPEKLSIGLTGIRAEGRRTTTFVMVVFTIGLVVGFASGQLSVLMNACFGLRPF
jgi:hypothetical protein